MFGYKELFKVKKPASRSDRSTVSVQMVDVFIPVYEPPNSLHIVLSSTKDDLDIYFFNLMLQESRHRAEP